MVQEARFLCGEDYWGDLHDSAGGWRERRRLPFTPLPCGDLFVCWGGRNGEVGRPKVPLPPKPMPNGIWIPVPAPSPQVAGLDCLPPPSPQQQDASASLRVPPDSWQGHLPDEPRPQGCLLGMRGGSTSGVFAAASLDPFERFEFRSTRSAATGCCSRWGGLRYWSSLTRPQFGASITLLSVQRLSVAGSHGEWSHRPPSFPQSAFVPRFAHT